MTNEHTEWDGLLDIVRKSKKRRMARTQTGEETMRTNTTEYVQFTNPENEGSYPLTLAELKANFREARRQLNAAMNAAYGATHDEDYPDILATSIRYMLTAAEQCESSSRGDFWGG